MDGFLNNIKHKTYIIAEIGSNHDGSFETAQAMIVKAAESGADAVKFQAYKTEKLIAPGYPVFPRAKPLGYTSQYDRFKDLEFSASQFRELSDLARKSGISFLASVFDIESADIIHELVPVFKLASGELINIKLLKYVTSKGKPIILSTGQASEDEIDYALSFLPENKVALLHCVSSYPTPDSQVNLLSISRLKKKYGRMPIGYSDHSLGTLACVSAVALGAVIIEKHFTLDKTLNYGDHILSAEPEELRQMIDDIRRLEQMLGEESVVCLGSEKLSRKQLRRVFVLATDGVEGAIINDEMLSPIIAKQTGIPANEYCNILGKKLTKALPSGHVLQYSDIA